MKTKTDKQAPAAGSVTVHPRLDPRTGLIRMMGSASVRSVIASLICILGGMAVGFIVLLIMSLTNEDIPVGDAFTGLGIILGGPFASGRLDSVLFNFGDMLLETTPVLMTGLSVAIAFKTGLFNIGAPGQYLMGAAASLLVALSIPTTPSTAFLVWLLALLAGMAAGALWGAIPGLFKAFFNVNEVIVCIMTNWIAANLVSWVFDSIYRNEAIQNKYINIAETKTKFVCNTATNGVMTPKLGLDKLFPGSNVDISIFIAILFAVGVFILLNKTTLGYELKACGFNRHGAKYAGMNEKRNIILSMVIAGGLAAGGAALWYLNGKNDMLWNTYSSLPSDGFNGIPVALLASNHPLGVIFSSLFLRYVGKGGFNLTGYTMFNEYVSDLIVAMIIYFAGFSKLLKEMLATRHVRVLEKRAAAETAAKASEGEASEGEASDGEASAETSEADTPVNAEAPDAGEAAENEAGKGGRA